jgi:hypothetical protein
MARDTYIKIQNTYEDELELPQLCSEDLCISTAILGAAQVGQRNAQLPWIWSFGVTVEEDGTWMDECRCKYNFVDLNRTQKCIVNRVHWLHAKAQFQ